MVLLEYYFVWYHDGNVGSLMDWNCEMKVEPTQRSQQRNSRETWLRKALETIARDGDKGVRIDALARDLNITKGSFYHHFRDRQDFIDQVVDFWVERYNRYVIETIEQFEGSPEDRLRSLMKLLKREELDAYDMTFRAWAVHDPGIAKRVRQVDLTRYGFIRGLFEEMGFEGTDLELRTRIWLVFAAANATVSFPVSSEIGEDLFVESHAFFVGKMPSGADQ